MSRKHFIALGDAMRCVRPVEDGEYGRTSYRQWMADCRSLAAFCERQNPRFDREKWMQYVNK